MSRLVRVCGLYTPCAGTRPGGLARRIPKEWALQPRHRDRVQRLLWIFEGQDASKMPPRLAKRQQDTSMRPQDASKRPQDASKTGQEASKNAQDSLRRPKIPSKMDASWTQIGCKFDPILKKAEKHADIVKPMNFHRCL